MAVSNPRDIRKYYQALVNRDPGFVGIFYVGVKTTGIFCIATCRARKPKPENVEFFTCLREVLREGYRPCKICRPAAYAHQPPSDIARALLLLKDASKPKVTDADLRQAGLGPERVRRWFKQHYGITFQAYQRMIRINTAYQELKRGNTVTDSAFNAGYESLSGFGYTFKKVMGRSPESMDRPPILISRLTTPLGPMYACASPEGICLLEFTDRRMLETEFEDLQRRLQTVIIAGENEHTDSLRKELAEYFAGHRREFTVPLHTPGTPFQQSVWRELLTIPYGHTRSYQQQAERLHRPNATRAVAAANGHNRVAIVIPCHRVIGKDGNLRGYAGGLERKKWLLEHEQANENAQGR